MWGNFATILPLKSELSWKCNIVSMLLMKVLKCWKIVEFPKISIKKFKTWSKTRKPAWENHSAPTHQIKTSYVSVTKLFLWRFAGIYRHLLSSCFENAVFGCIKMVHCKCFIWHQPETGFQENLWSK